MVFTSPLSEEVRRLLRSLYEDRSLSDGLGDHDAQIASITHIAESRELRVVPHLLPLLADGGTLAPHVARAISALVGDVSPAQLSLLDEQVRQVHVGERQEPWHTLRPDALPRLADAADFDVMVIGLVASHPSGFVRAAALEVLGQCVDGREIPFLSLRANDWVEPVAARARALLMVRLRPDNRHAVLNALPFLVRVLGQRRRDHAAIERALRMVLLSDGGEEALSRGAGFEFPVRRMLYDLLIGGGTAGRRGPIEAALRDPDAVTRARTLRVVATDPEFEHREDILERFLRDDAVPTVRMLALRLITEHLPGRIAGLYPGVLLDRAARVRSLARFVATARRLPVVPRDVYVRSLAAAQPQQISAAIDGLGETGTRTDAELIAPCLDSAVPRIRRSALRALARLDPERAISASIAALTDGAPSVRSAAADAISTNGNRVNFEIVSHRVRLVTDPQVRRHLLGVFLAAPKWDALFFLLEALADPEDSVRAFATRLIGRWIDNFNRSQSQPTAKQLERIATLLDSVASRLPDEAVRMLRFSLRR